LNNECARKCIIAHPIKPNKPKQENLMLRTKIAFIVGFPVELVEFHVWYLKAKGWVERIDTGYLAITALGVDQVEQGRLRLRKDHMLMAGGVAPNGAEGQTTLRLNGFP
jgi:hypothetical protein